MGNSSGNPNKFKQYDAAFLYSDKIIEINSIIEIKNGWKIFTNPKYKPDNNKYHDYPVAILSYDNNMKAEFINKFCGFKKSLINLNTFDKIKGIKMRFSKNALLNDLKKIKKEKNIAHILKRVIFFTSSGHNDPIYYHSDELLMKFMNRQHAMKEIILKENETQIDGKRVEELKIALMDDKYMTEAFCDNYILEISNLILVVVGEMKFKDQKYIEDIVTRYKNRKKIFIIHYFSNEINVIGVRQKIDKEIKSLFLVKEVYMDLSKYFKNVNEELYNKSVFVEQDVNEPMSFLNPDERDLVIHLVFAKDDSPAGQYYNIANLRYIKDFIYKNINYNKGFDLESTFKKFLNDYYSDYFTIVNKKDELRVDIDVKQKEENGVSFLCPIIDHKIKLNYFSDMVYNVLDKFLNEDKGKYMKYQLIEKEKQIDIQIDLPCLIRETVRVKINLDESNYQYLDIIGEKFNKIDKELNYFQDVIDERGSSYFGKFTLHIPLGPHSKRLKKKTIATYKEGILFITLFKCNMNFVNIKINNEFDYGSDEKSRNYNFEENFYKKSNENSNFYYKEEEKNFEEKKNSDFKNKEKENDEDLYSKNSLKANLQQINNEVGKKPDENEIEDNKSSKDKENYKFLKQQSSNKKKLFELADFESNADLSIASEKFIMKNMMENYSGINGQNKRPE